MTIAFDIDGTLITDDDKPREEVIHLFKALQRGGHTMIVWSTGGVVYAERWARDLGLTGYQVWNKLEPHEVPDLAIDDERADWGKMNIHIHRAMLT